MTRDPPVAWLTNHRPFAGGATVSCDGSVDYIAALNEAGTATQSTRAQPSPHPGAELSAVEIMSSEQAIAIESP